MLLNKPQLPNKAVLFYTNIARSTDEMKSSVIFDISFERLPEMLLRVNVKKKEKKKNFTSCILQFVTGYFEVQEAGIEVLLLG